MKNKNFSETLMITLLLSVIWFAKNNFNNQKENNVNLIASSNKIKDFAKLKSFATARSDGRLMDTICNIR